MPSPLLETPPFTTPLISQGGMMHPRWTDWFQLGVIPRLDASPEQVRNTLSLTAQNASIPATTLYTVVQAGLYRVTWYLRVTTAAGVSSSIQLAIGSTDGGVTCSQNAAAAYTGNATNAPQSGVLLVRADQATSITYATTYASNAAGVMEYRLDLVVESVG